MQQQARLKAQLNQQEDALRQLCAGLLPFALIPSLCEQLKEQLLSEEHAAQVEAGRALLQSAKEEILQRVGAADFWAELPGLPEKLKTDIQNRLLQTIEEPFHIGQMEQVEDVHQLSTLVQRQLLSWIDQAIHEIPKQARSLARELENCYRELHKVEEALRRIPADDVLKPLLEELHNLHRELAEASSRVLTTDEALKAAEVRLSELRQQYRQTTEKLAAEATRTSRIHLAHRVQKVLDEYKASLIDKKVAQLQGAVSECFNTLCRKKDALRKILIDPRDFSVTLYDRQNRPLPKSQLSAGEKQIYAISMLWALAKTSGRPLPIMIDTPLGRLDSDHRASLVHHYFPVASHQVIILSTDTEVDRSYFAALRQDIAHAYRLEFDPVENGTTITAGYFWKDTHEAHEAPAL